jgi:hypothetical protein
MLQAHSYLWHYLWIGPHVLQVFLAVFVWRRGLYKIFPVFLLFLVFEALEEFTLYGLDILPSVSSDTFWQAYSVGLILEELVKLVLIGELFGHLLRPWPALSKFGYRLISGIGAGLVLLSVLAAAYTPIDNPQYIIASRAHIMEQTFYIIECGLVLSLFLFAAYFRLRWNNLTFGIALGLGILSCEHLATWAVMANGGLIEKRHLLDFVNMATYHLCVLIWFYYLLIPEKLASQPAVQLPENNLEIWNRELERLLQQ